MKTLMQDLYMAFYLTERVPNIRVHANKFMFLFSETFMYN